MRPGASTHPRRATTVVVALLAAACDGAGGGGVPGALTGTIALDGSSTVFPLAETMAEDFQLRHPGVRITVGFSGTGGGFQRFCRGETELATASREIAADEAALCRRNGVAWIEVPIALDGVSVVANREAEWVSCLTVSELRRVWRRGSTIRRWRQLRPDFPDLPLRLYGAGPSSGTFDHFTAAVVGAEGASRSDYQASEDDNVLVRGVLGDLGALAHVGYAYVVRNRERLRVLGVDAGGGCVTPTPETIAEGSYTPLSRPLFFYLSETAARRPAVAAFVDFVLASATELVPRTGYLPLSERRYAELRRRLPG